MAAVSSGPNWTPPPIIPLKKKKKIIAVTVGIRKENLPNTSLGRDRYASPTADDDRDVSNAGNRRQMRGCQRDGYGDHRG
jgi:hypothetical protein